MIFVIRTDANPVIGNGHLMRCMTFCKLLEPKEVKIHLIYANLTVFSKEILIKTDIELHKINLKSSIGSLEDANQTKKILEELPKIDLLIIDSYQIDDSWEKLMVKYTKQIMVIDDLANRSHYCNFLVDQNLRFDNKRYDKLLPPNTKVFLGPKYAFLREEFYNSNLIRLRNGSLRNILVFFGSGNNNNEIIKILKVINEIEDKEIKWNLVIGKNIKKFSKYISAKNNLEIIDYTENISKLMYDADLAIGTCGIAAWERCLLGLPSIVLITAQNQYEDALILDKKKAVINLGYSRYVKVNNLLLNLKNIIQDEKILIKMSINSREILKGHREAIQELVNYVSISLETNRINNEN
ncbi:MAG: UDP-2,4-diacetamido-2,4,6-trideoxy-beta-L-altropyranose hydrolase [Candidatus Endolissoclinum sp. TMED37]|nr:MAG: UDP-2,4-diacetamido-2,4,6-trideoxy-beta-L-altropyranose hydrolase [Candidatus Endolissoclinum sp. TMED37]